MQNATGIVEGGRIVLPEDVHLPEGTRVRVEWDESPTEWGPPLEREAWGAADVQQEIEWARTWRWDP
jgi:hypothetical protein